MADIEVSEEIKIKLTEPKKWKVVILNDDVTPIDFVIAMLMEIFNHSSENAYNITMSVHETGSGIAGVFDFEIAEIKAIESTKMARENGFPLQIKIEQSK